MPQKDFIKAGFTVVDANNEENKLLSFLKENYPNVIRDNEINIEELKAVLDLPIDEKVNGYGLNFVGRNFARAKYSKKTEKELHLNTSLSKEIDKTENLVLKGDNLDSLKILKNHYTGKIKCIYIDPPYNTTSDEFVYPDKFDKEEAEVLGLANLSESDFDRMDFSFKTKKSHNGWLAFMYPRLLLARDLLSKDGVIFISIDDNEQANLKLLCDDVFGEENFVANLIWKCRAGGGSDSKFFSSDHEYILCYSKYSDTLEKFYIDYTEEQLKKFQYTDENGNYFIKTLEMPEALGKRPNLQYPIKAPDGTYIKEKRKGVDYTWVISENEYFKYLDNNLIEFRKSSDKWMVYRKYHLNTVDGEIRQTKPRSIIDKIALTSNGSKELKKIFNIESSIKIFDNPKPIELLTFLFKIITKNDESILDFFAGSGSTGQAVMQLNAEDGGNRKFILCQIDEPIDKKKPAYKFCVENNLPPVISSITTERLKRAGEKIAKEIQEQNKKAGMFKEHKKQIPDIGYKVFDSVDSPKLEVDDSGQISINLNDNDTLSRIYNMIFTIGLDEPSQVPEEVVKECIYKIGDHYYITNSEKVSKEDFSNAIRNGKVFIDGWTASLNGTLQNYKEDVKIVF